MGSCYSAAARTIAIARIEASGSAIPNGCAGAELPLEHGFGAHRLGLRVVEPAARQLAGHTASEPPSEREEQHRDEQDDPPPGDGEGGETTEHDDLHVSEQR